MKTNLLRPLLAREHAEWRHEVDAALNAARRNEAGPWARWNALRYLAGGFPAQAAKERRLVQSVDARLSPAQRAHLWALGELLEILPAYLGHLIGLCHRAGDFADVTGRILVALDHWCGAVEEALGPLPVSAVPGEVLEDLGVSTREAIAVGS